MIRFGWVLLGLFIMGNGAQALPIKISPSATKALALSAASRLSPDQSDITTPADPNFDQLIVGHWFYYKKIYKGTEMPEPPEATLRLHFEFYADGTDKLYWTHVGETDHCIRKGKYKFEKNELVDDVVWVDPDNSAECGRDPDMQQGKTTRTPISFHENGDMWFHLFLGGDDLMYVWKRLTP